MNPQASLQTLAEAGTANVAMAHSLALSTLAFVERLAAAQAAFMRTSLERAADFTPLEEGQFDWSALAARQNAAMRDAAERTGAWFRDICEAGSEAQASATEAVSTHLAETGDALGSFLDGVAADAPAGSASMLNAARSALAGNRMAYDSLASITRRISEANAAVVDDAVKVMGSASTPARKRKAA